RHRFHPLAGARRSILPQVVGPRPGWRLEVTQKNEQRRLGQHARGLGMVSGLEALGLRLEPVLEVATEPPRLGNEFPPLRDARQRKGRKRCGYACLAVECRGERRRIRDSLGYAAADVGPDEEGRITDECDPAERHGGAFQIVNALQKRLLDLLHDPEKAWWQQALGRLTHLGDDGLPEQRRRDRELMLQTASIRQKGPQFALLVGRPVPDNVPAAVLRAQVIVGPGYRIA